MFKKNQFCANVCETTCTVDKAILLCTGILRCRYRKWDLGNGLHLVARCEHDAATYGPNSELQLVNIKALNEWDSRVSRLSGQRKCHIVTTSRNTHVC